MVVVFRNGKFLDPRRPRPPLNAYILFCIDHRFDIAENNPSLSFSDVGRALGGAWAAISEELRAEYVKKAEKGLRRYEKRYEIPANPLYQSPNPTKSNQSSTNLTQSRKNLT
jgi:hypothetical protein